MKTVEVVCGVIFNNNSEVLITQRGDGNLKGKWEFPGGKVEIGESYEYSLKRELQEELNINTQVKDFILVNSILIGDKTYKLLFYSVEIVSGFIELREHSNYKWVNPFELKEFDFLEGDIPMIDFLSNQSISI